MPDVEVRMIRLTELELDSADIQEILTACNEGGKIDRLTGRCDARKFQEGYAAWESERIRRHLAKALPDFAVLQERQPDDHQLAKFGKRHLEETQGHPSERRLRVCISASPADFAAERDVISRAVCPRVNHDPEVLARGVTIEISDPLWGKPIGPPGAGMAVPQATPSKERIETHLSRLHRGSSSWMVHLAGTKYGASASELETGADPNGSEDLSLPRPSSPPRARSPLRGQRSPQRSRFGPRSQPEPPKARLQDQRAPSPPRATQLAPHVQLRAPLVECEVVEAWLATPEDAVHGFVYARDPEFLTSIESREDLDVFLTDFSSKPKAKARLEWLWAQMARHRHLTVRRYPCEVGGVVRHTGAAAGWVSGLAAFEEQLYLDLKRHIVAQFPILPTPELRAPRFVSANDQKAGKRAPELLDAASEAEVVAMERRIVERGVTGVGGRVSEGPKGLEACNHGFVEGLLEVSGYIYTL